MRRRPIQASSMEVLMLPFIISPERAAGIRPLPACRRWRYSPRPTITATVSGQNWYSDVFTLTGTVSSLVPLAGVWFQVNSDGWQLAATTNHWTNWTATAANLMAGTNILQAYAADMFGHNSAIVSVNLNYIASFNFTNINGTITVTSTTGRHDSASWRPHIFSASILSH